MEEKEIKRKIIPLADFELPEEEKPEEEKNVPPPPAEEEVKEEDKKIASPLDNLPSQSSPRLRSGQAGLSGARNDANSSSRGNEVTAAISEPRKPKTALITVLVIAVLVSFGIFTSFLFFKNLHLSIKLSDMREKARSNAEVAKKLVLEKEELLKTHAPLRGENENLKRELTSSQNISAGLKQQNESLQRQITELNTRLIELKTNMQSYAGEVKGLVSSEIKYYHAYEQEKEGKKKLADEIKSLESNIAKLQSELKNIDKKQGLQEADYAYNIAFVYAKAQMFDEAVQSFLRCLELAGDSADIHYNLAIIYDEVKKDGQNALRHYEEYLRLNPEAEDLYEIKMRVESLKRTGSAQSVAPDTMKTFSVDMDKLKF